MISSRFGVASFGMVRGLTAQLQMPLRLVALRFIGSNCDRTGSYDQAFLIFALIIPISLITALAIGRPTFRTL